MGRLLNPTKAMGEYSVEVRRESFYITGEYSFEKQKTHAFFLYPHTKTGQGAVEILIEDIPKIKAAIRQVEAYVRKHKPELLPKKPARTKKKVEPSKELDQALTILLKRK